MLDLETMDNTSDSAIVSIGACVDSAVPTVISLAKSEIDVDPGRLLTTEAQVGGSTGTVVAQPEVGGSKESSLR